MMKDLVLSGRVVRREILILLGCFLAAVGVNAFSIIKYHTPFSELFTQIGYVVVVALVFFVVLTLIRVLLFLIAKIFRK